MRKLARKDLPRQFETKGKLTMEMPQEYELKDMTDGCLSAADCLRLLEQRGFSGRGRFDAEDLAYLQVALMVAALDGRIESREYDMFERLANRCEGATREKVDAAMDTALRSAGYLLLLSDRLDEDELAERFADEAMKILSSGLGLGRVESERLKSAFGMWRAMAEADGDFSPVERRCLVALYRRMREMLVERELRELERSRYHLLRGTDGDLQHLAQARVDELLPRSMVDWRAAAFATRSA